MKMRLDIGQDFSRSLSDVYDDGVTGFLKLSKLVDQQVAGHEMMQTVSQASLNQFKRTFQIDKRDAAVQRNECVTRSDGER